MKITYNAPKEKGSRLKEPFSEIMFFYELFEFAQNVFYRIFMNSKTHHF